MADNDENLARVTSVRSEMEGGVIVSGLEDRGIKATMSGVYTTNFRAERPVGSRFLLPSMIWRALRRHWKRSRPRTTISIGRRSMWVSRKTNRSFLASSGHFVHPRVLGFRREIWPEIRLPRLSPDERITLKDLGVQLWLAQGQVASHSRFATATIGVADCSAGRVNQGAYRYGHAISHCGGCRRHGACVPVCADVAWLGARRRRAWVITWAATSRVTHTWAATSMAIMRAARMPTRMSTANSTHIFSVISFRTLVAAIAFFGVSGRAALSAGYAPSMSFILAVIVGVAAMYGMYWLMRLVAGLNSSGNERIDNAVGRQATVYLRDPGDAVGCRQSAAVDAKSNCGISSVYR